MALRLKQLGIPRVFPLTGGFDAWRELDLPLENFKRGKLLVSWWG